MIDYLQNVDTQGRQWHVSTSAVIHTSNLFKDMPAATLHATMVAQEKNLSHVKVQPMEKVDSGFMRHTNEFVKIN